MSEDTITLEVFKRKLREELTAICAARNWNYDNNKLRGMAFQLWFADLLQRANRGIETTPDDACMDTGDLGVDVAMEDTLAERLFLAQCRHNPKPIAEEAINSFLGIHGRILDREYVRKYGKGAALELLGEYKDQLARNFTVTYYFATIGTSTPKVAHLVDTRNKELADDNVSVRFVVLDLSELKEFYLRTTSLEGSVGINIRETLPASLYFTRDKPYPTLVAAVKANWIRNIYHKGGAKERIFALNIRDWLGRRNNINRRIVETVRDEPAHFFYFNNGISAVCTRLLVDSETHQLEADDFQIINGAQTVGAIVDAAPREDAYVLLRITESSGSKSAEKPMNEKIIRFNNSQNAVNVSDFRANDQIQVWLERELARHSARTHLPAITYQRRRGTATRARKGSRLLKLEELGKVRYAFEHEPTLVINSPKDLFTSRGDHSEGAYELAFGTDGKLDVLWTQDVLDRCLLAIAFYLRAGDYVDELRAKDDALRFLNQLRFHFVSLAGEVVRRHYTAAQITELVKGEKAFEKAWDSIARTGLAVLRSEWRRNESSKEPMTLRTFARSKDIWRLVVDAFFDLRDSV